MKHSALIVAVAATLFSGAVFSGHETIKPAKNDNLAKCVKAALTAHEGNIVKLEAKVEAKKTSF